MNVKRFGLLLIRGIALVLLVLIFIELGIWQLHRAREVSAASKPTPDKPVIALELVAQPGRNLSSTGINRIVKTSGRYIATYRANNQELADGKWQSLEVRLLETTAGGEILVVRQISGAHSESIDQNVTVVGRLYPRQIEDRGASSASELARLDPALLTGGKTPDGKRYHLYDGYIVARSETTTDGRELVGKRISTPQLHAQAAGFYWQHISYVVVWWFMAGLVLIAPLFPNFRQRASQAK